MLDGIFRILLGLGLFGLLFWFIWHKNGELLKVSILIIVMILYLFGGLILVSIGLWLIGSGIYKLFW